MIEVAGFLDARMDVDDVDLRHGCESVGVAPVAPMQVSLPFGPDERRQATEALQAKSIVAWIVCRRPHTHRLMDRYLTNQLSYRLRDWLQDNDMDEAPHWRVTNNLAVGLVVAKFSDASVGLLKERSTEERIMPCPHF